MIYDQASPPEYAAKVERVVAALKAGPLATSEDRRQLEPALATPTMARETLEKLNEIIRAGMIRNQARRKLHAQNLEIYCDDDPEAMSYTVDFMRVMAERLAPHHQRFITVMEEIMPVIDEDLPANRWQRGLHASVLKELVVHRQDIAVDLCIGSWNSGLMPAATREAYILHNARFAVSYAMGEALARQTSRAVCRMSRAERLQTTRLGMVSLRETLANRTAGEVDWPSLTAAAAARQVLSLVGLERLNQALQRPESPNPKDAAIAAYCEEICQNLPSASRLR